jgi:SAM-dependent methyltransferase
MSSFFPATDPDSARREIFEIIRERARKAHSEEAPSVQISRGHVQLLGLREGLRELQLTHNLVGQMPPEPPTLRGRVGAWLIRRIRRLLVWYTPQIVAFQRSATRALETMAGAMEEVAAATAAADARLSGIDAEIQSLRDELAREAKRRVAAEAIVKDLGMELAQLSALVRSMRDSGMRRLDGLYLEFENQFRGERKDIKNRLRVYLPLLREHGIGTPLMPVLDVGCGRGEWLELLRESGMTARGVDNNRAMLTDCRERQLPVEEGDAVDYLRTLEAGSLGCVTGHHIIEHLPFASLVDLLDETVRILKPGGVAIFETPNPANLMVGAERFYFDPTHRNPLPSPLMRFLVEARGLDRVGILELQPGPEEMRLPDDGSKLTERFNQMFYGPQDYAVIGWKV